MRSYLSTDLKEEIRRRVDLADLAAAHVALKKTGRYYKGLCPFHQEKTPSFHVDRERGLWHCFGCAQGGDVFDFVMRISNLSFAEAVEELAKRAGVRLERTAEEAKRTSERDRLLRALDAAAKFFRDQLVHATKGKAARDYLDRRGVSTAVAERFMLGYAPPGWDELLRALAVRGYPPGVLEPGGVVVARQSGEGYYDLFRDRVIFPILDLQDRPVAFGGRALDDAQPKYLNSKETPVFVKGRTLYALSWAREAIRQRDEIVVVEGNMDVLTCHQFGITHAVASLGTALTLDQVLLMKRFASKAILVYDSDAAGQTATARAMTLFEEADLPLRIVVLPQHDPDEFLRSAGEGAFRAALEQALPVFDYQVSVAVARHDPRTLEGRVRIVDELSPAIAAVTNPVRQAEYVRELAERFGVHEDALRQRLRAKVRGRMTPPVQAPLVTEPDRARQRAERLLLHLMIQETTLRPVVAARLTPDDFADPMYREVAKALLGAPDQEPAGVRERIGDEGAQSLFVRLLFEEAPVMAKEKAKVLQEAIQYLVHWEPVALRRAALASEIQAAQRAGDIEQVRRLQVEYVKLVGQHGPSGKGGEDHAQKEGGL